MRAWLQFTCLLLLFECFFGRQWIFRLHFCLLQFRLTEFLHLALPVGFVRLGLPRRRSETSEWEESDLLSDLRCVKNLGAFRCGWILEFKFIWTQTHSYLLSHLLASVLGGSSSSDGPQQLQTCILLGSWSAQQRASGLGYDWSKMESCAHPGANHWGQGEGICWW